MRKIAVKSYAKINLALDVLGKRPDGYHQVEMIMQGIDLWDRVEVSRTSRPGIELVCPYPETGPAGENLAYRAALLLAQATGIQPGIRIEIQKKIPVAAGLAGGSADGAAVLLALNELYQLGLGSEKLQDLAGQLGSDVPFCLWPATALAQGRGEQLTGLPALPSIWLVLFKPSYGVSTAQVYQNLHNVRIYKRPDIPGIMTGLKEGKLDRILQGMGNVLEYSTFALHPELQEQVSRIKKLGALRVMMTGSGPTLMAFTQGEEEARQLAEKWERQDWTVMVARTLEERDLQERVELYE